MCFVKCPDSLPVGFLVSRLEHHHILTLQLNGHSAHGDQCEGGELHFESGLLDVHDSVLAIFGPTH